jgi:hypothetical protein
MAERPVFIPSSNDSCLVEEVFLPLHWHSGFAAIQKEKNIVELHSVAKANGIGPLLEVSSKSQRVSGRHLSAFHLKVNTGRDRTVPLECAFQASKVFESGGPYLDLLNVEPREARRDPRLRSSGTLKRFEFQGKSFPLEPKSFFYDWLYINAIYEHRVWLQKLTGYAGFTDIEFNPHKSINCQARSIALFITLLRRNLLDDAISAPENLRKILVRFDYHPDIRPTNSVVSSQSKKSAQISPQDDMFDVQAPSTTGAVNHVDPDDSFSLRAPEGGPPRRGQRLLRTKAKPESVDRVPHRGEWILILEEAALPESSENNDLWGALMKSLKLPLGDYPHLVEAIREGRWRLAKDPRSYIKTVTRRISRAANRSPEDDVTALLNLPANDQTFSFEKAIDLIGLRQGTQASKGTDGVWRRGSGISDEEEVDEEGRPLSQVPYRETLLRFLPSTLKDRVIPFVTVQAALDKFKKLTSEISFPSRHTTEVQWKDWADAAGLDGWEQHVLIFKVNGISRDRALDKQPTDEARRLLQAAWRRFDRSGTKRLLQVAKKKTEKTSRIVRSGTLHK